MFSVVELVIFCFIGTNVALAGAYMLQHGVKRLAGAGQK